MTAKRVTIAAAFALLVAALAWAATSSGAGARHALQIESKSGVQNFMVEVAATPAEHQKGLMYRTELAADAGMIFLFGAEPRVVSFWMKNTLIPLDMIFIGPDARVVRVHDNAIPEDLTGISSGAGVVAVLEVAGGQARQRGIQAGDPVRFPQLDAMMMPKP